MFKAFDQKSDIGFTISSLYENVEIYSQSFVDDDYVRKYNNASYYHVSSALSGYVGYYQTIYDATPVTSPTSNALLDITYGMSTGSTNYASTVVQREQKNYIYKIFANQLLGSTNDIFAWSGTEYHDLVFLTVKRNVYKDYLRDRFVTMWVTASSGDPNNVLTASDSCSAKIAEAYGGNYGPLYSCSSGDVVGLCFYNAGVIAISSGAFYGDYFSGSYNMPELITGSNIDSIVDGARGHIHYLNIHPASRIHTALYRCTLLDKEFNYSSNPTYTDNTGLIRVISGSLAVYGDEQARIYITTIGLYDDQDNLLAVGKLSYPVMKNPQQSMILVCKVDY